MEEENKYNCTDDESLVQNWSSEAAKWCMLDSEGSKWCISEDGESRMCSNDMDNDGNGAEDMVNHPSHYTWLKEKCGIEVIDITRHLDFDIGNAVKYLLRAGHKKEPSLSENEKAIEDLEKAIFYINDKIAMLKRQNNDKKQRTYEKREYVKK